MSSLGIEEKKIRMTNTFTSRTTMVLGNNQSTSSSTSPSTSEALFHKGITARGGPIDNWKWRIQNGQRASTTLAGERFKCDWQPSRLQGVTVVTFSPVEETTTVENRTLHVQQSLPPRGAQLGFGTANNKAIATFVSKARTEQSSFMGGVFLGELREALRLLRPASWALSRGMEQGYLNSVRNRIFKSKKKRRGSSTRGRQATIGRTLSERSQIVADTWLEHSFGWAPFMNDIESASKELSRLVNTTKPESRRIQAGFKDQLVTTEASNSASISNIECLSTCKRTYEVDVRYKGAVKIACQGTTASVRESFGLTMSQFIPTLWELVPYSFLVDYFTNAGDIVSCASFPRADLVYIVKGTKWRNELRYSPAGVIRTPSDSIVKRTASGIFGATVFEREGVERIDFVDPLVPTLEFNLPGHKRQLFNLAALGLASKRTQRLVSQL
jgi:hypothetical protein